LPNWLAGGLTRAFCLKLKMACNPQFFKISKIPTPKLNTNFLSCYESQNSIALKYYRLTIPIVLIILLSLSNEIGQTID